MSWTLVKGYILKDVGKYCVIFFNLNTKINIKQIIKYIWKVTNITDTASVYENMCRNPNHKWLKKTWASYYGQAQQ